MIRNILFDLGNVLLDIDPRITESELEKITGIPFKEAYSDHREIFDKFEKGKFGYVVFFNYLTKITHNKAYINELLRAWNAMLLVIRPEIRDFLLRISRDYNCYLLSNTNESHLERFDRYLRKINLYDQWYDGIFKQCFYSHVIGPRKPETECFEYVVQSAGLLPKETLYIDDTREHIQSASRLGFHTLLFDRYQDNIEAAVLSFIRNLK